MLGEPKYDDDVINLGYLNARLGKLDIELGNTNTLLLSKTQNFGTLPQPPYHRYDTYMGPAGIYICHTERLIGEYNPLDWGKASTYENVGDAFDRGIITAGTLQASNGGTNTAGLTGQGTSDSSVRIWAGSSYANRGSAPFRITQTGRVDASNLNITGGSLTWDNLNKPTKSDLGTWTTYINNNGIYTGTLTANQVNAVDINADNITAGTLDITRLGAGTITGDKISSSTIITAGSGNNIGGLGVSGSWRIWAGNSTPGSAPFRVSQAGALTSTSGNIGGFNIGSESLSTTRALLASNGTFLVTPTSGGLIQANNSTGIRLIGDSTTMPVIISDGTAYGSAASNTSINLVAGYQKMRLAGNNSISILAGRSQSATADAETNQVSLVGARSGDGHLKANSAVFIYAPIGSIRLNASSNTVINAGSVMLQSTGSGVFLQPGGSGSAYVGSEAAVNKIMTSSAGPSSRNVKTNIDTISNYNDIYNDIRNMNLYSFDYKYMGISEDKHDFGFIIDELESLPNIGQYVKHYSVQKYIKDDTLIPDWKIKEEDVSEYEPLNIKEWDSSSYIKTSFLMIKALQEKIDLLEERLSKLEGGN